MTTTPPDEALANRAARDVEGNPHEVCRDFQPQTDHPWWCATCKWNEPLHRSVDRHHRGHIVSAPLTPSGLAALIGRTP